MKSLTFEHKTYLDAFMKTAQYLASLPAHDDIWHHIAEVMVKFYGADLAGFAQRGLDGRMELHHLVLPSEIPRKLLSTEDIGETITEVLETGFLSWRIFEWARPHTVFFLPVNLGNETGAVMLVGHALIGPVENELLNVYLAVSGLAGSTITRLSSEIELEKANDDLKEKTRIAQTLMDALPCIALLLRSDKVVVGSNKRAADLGIVPGRKCYEGWKAEDKPCAGCSGFDTLPIATVQRREIEAGKTCWDTYWVPINDDLHLHYAFDITDRKQSERELKAYAERLEFLNRELQEFAFVASHDLQEPLRKIQTFGHLLEVGSRQSLTEKARDYLQRMTQSAKRMSTLLDALLSYSRVAAKPEPYVSASLSAIATDAVSDLELAINRAGARVEIGPLPAAEVDPNQMRQLFQNLIGNAIKYRKEGEPPEIRVFAKSTDISCILHVQDNGIGFKEEYLDRIFKPFQRLHGRHEYEGTGMGLAICRKIAERHGGTITARSDPGHGSVFIVTLPIRQGRSETDDGSGPLLTFTEADGGSSRAGHRLLPPGPRPAG
jgi:signal transduction histidine kinase